MSKIIEQAEKNQAVQTKRATGLIYYKQGESAPKVAQSAVQKQAAPVAVTADEVPQTQRKPRRERPEYVEANTEAEYKRAPRDRRNAQQAEYQPRRSKSAYSERDRSEQAPRPRYVPKGKAVEETAQQPPVKKQAPKRRYAEDSYYEEPVAYRTRS